MAPQFFVECLGYLADDRKQEAMMTDRSKNELSPARQFRLDCYTRDIENVDLYTI